MQAPGKIEVARLDHVMYVRVSGLATMHNCGSLSELCHNMLDASCEEVVFDLAQCTGMDSTFMGTMAGLARRREEGPCVVVVANADDHTRKLMDVLGLSYIVDVRDDPIHAPDVETQELRDDWVNEHDKIEFIKQAHEHLIAIDQRNHERFGPLLDAFALQFGQPIGARKVKFAICNEFCENMPIGQVFKLAADTGYQGVEIAPFTIADDVRDISGDQRREIKQQAADCGVEVVGLHWLLVKPEGLYVNHEDKAIRDKTAEYFRALIHCCADLGGAKMVIGSPKQRNVREGLTYEQAWRFAKDVFISLLPDADAREVDLCIEPLARTETDFIYTAAEGLKMVKEIGHPRFLVHLDVKAMADEGRPMNDIITECKGYVGHFHANDANRSYPGSGDTDFAPIVEGLRAIGYTGWVSVEVFDFTPGPQKIAAESMKYLKEKFGA